jgi:glutamate transport system permease protein
VDAVLDNLDTFRQGFVTTLALTVVSTVLALALGTLLAAMRVSPVSTLRAAGATYVEVVRNTPLTVVFFFAVFVLPQLDVRLSFFVFAVIAVTVYHAAFFTFTQSLRLVVLPQAFRTVVPPLINVVIALTKNTSIAGAFGVVELTAVATRLANANSEAVIAIFLGSAVCYLALTLPSGWLAGQLERRVAVAR